MRPGSLTWISACDKIRKHHVSLISARCLHLSISMQIIRDDSTESGEPSLGTRNSHRLFLVLWFFLTLWTGGSVAEEYLIPPDNLKGRDDRPPLIWVWQEHTIKAAVSLCRKQYYFREREPVIKKITKNVYSEEIGTCSFFSFPISVFSVYMMLALECKSWSVFQNINYSSTYFSDLGWN